MCANEQIRVSLRSPGAGNTRGKTAPAHPPHPWNPKGPHARVCPQYFARPSVLPYLSVGSPRSTQGIRHSKQTLQYSLSCPRQHLCPHPNRRYKLTQKREKIGHPFEKLSVVWMAQSTTFLIELGSVFAQWAAAFGISVGYSVVCYLWCWRSSPDEARALPLLSQWLKLPSTVWVVLQLGQLHEHGFGAMQLKY